MRVMKTKLFEPGRLAATQSAFAAIERANQDVVDFFSRHVTGDWGEVSQEDRVENEVSLLNGYRLLSAYRTKLGERVWVLTEADRSMTTILLPEEY